MLMAVASTAKGVTTIVKQVIITATGSLPNLHLPYVQGRILQNHHFGPRNRPGEPFAIAQRRALLVQLQLGVESPAMAHTSIATMMELVANNSNV